MAEGIWDTGNSRTVISQELAERLGIDTSGERHLRGSSFGQGETTSAVVNICIGDDVIPMVEIDVVRFASAEHYDVILGMDVIARGRLEVDSTSGETVLTFDPLRDEDGQIPILRFVYDE
jgi:predicted aspartyl protease